MDWHEDADIFWRLDYRDPLKGVAVAFEGAWLHIRADGGVVHTFPIHDVDQVSWWEPGKGPGVADPSDVSPLFTR